MRTDLLLGVGSFLGGTLFISEGVRLGFWEHLSGPGAGFFPVVLGVAAVILAIPLLRMGIRNDADRISFRRSELAPVLCGVLFMSAITLAVSWLGMSLALFGYLVLWLRGTGGYSWVKSGAISLLVMTLLYLMFVTWLKVPLPKGLAGV